MIKSITKMKASDITAYAEEYAQKFNEDDLKTNQIRNFYAAVTAMRTDYQAFVNKSATEDGKTLEDIQWDLTMLKPKLAYAAGRQKAVREHFYDFMKSAIENVEEADSNEEKKEVFKNFFALIESVVGYHKFYGDK